MTKKIQSYIKLQVPAGMANPSPPIGPALGQKGVNIMEFCKSFNSKTGNVEHGLPLSVLLTVYSDRSFDFIIKTPPTSFLLKKAAGITTGASKPNKDKVAGKLTYAQIMEIAKLKEIDMTGSNIDLICKSIVGTAYSIGLSVIK